MARKKTQASSPEQAIVAPLTSPDTTKDKIFEQFCKVIDAGYTWKKPVYERFTQNQELYDGIAIKVGLKPGQIDYPLPIMGGFIDTLSSKTDDEPSLDFEHWKMAAKRAAQKVKAAWDFHSSPEMANWPERDRETKKIAGLTGRAIFKTYCESDPEFAHYLETVDTYDYVTAPRAGGDIKKHDAGAQDNVMRSKYDLEGAGHYDQVQVQRLTSSLTDANLKTYDIKDRPKLQRFESAGLKTDIYNDYSGDPMFRLTEGFIKYQGTMYYVFGDMRTRIWLRIEKMKDVFASGKHPFVSWATHPDPFNFWSKAPADDIRPICWATRDVFNEAMYNIKKRNKGQRAYDAEIFDEPDLLEFRPDGLVPATITGGRAIRDGIYEFVTPDNTVITVNLIQFLDNFTGQKTGITAGAQGNSAKDTKVGVYYGDMQQVADRLGLTNKFYAQAWRDLGKLYVWGLKEHMSDKMAVKILGESGWDLQELLKSEVDPDFLVHVRGGNAEMQNSAMEQKLKNDTLVSVSDDPLYARFLNPKIVVKNRLRSGKWKEDEIRDLMDLNYIGDEDSIIWASQALDDILSGQTPKIYYKASVAFQQHIKDFLDSNELPIATELRIQKYFDKMSPLIVKNMARRAQQGGPQVMLPPGMQRPPNNIQLSPNNPNPTPPAPPAVPTA